MEKIIGKVKEVYLPLEYKNNQVLDIMFRTNIGFTIETNNQEFIDIRKCEAYE